MTPGLGDFAGRWRLDRRVEDRLGEGDARFTGEAIFEAEGAVLHYRETGRLTVGETSFEAEQTHLWRMDGNRFHVCFSDGRPFHAFEHGIARPEAVHLCTPDHYTVRYDFGDWPAWSSEWQVSGPRKDYVMRTSYRRPA